MLYGHDEGKNIKQLCDGENDVVCIEMGGTGAYTRYTARKNLGIGGNFGQYKMSMKNSALSNDYTIMQLSEPLESDTLALRAIGNYVNCYQNGFVEVRVKPFIYSGFTVNDVVYVDVDLNGTRTTLLEYRTPLAAPRVTLEASRIFKVNVGDRISVYAQNQTGERGTIAQNLSLLSVKYLLYV